MLLELEAVDGDVLVPVDVTARQALRDAWASGLRVAGLTAGADYVLRA